MKIQHALDRYFSIMSMAAEFDEAGKIGLANNSRALAQSVADEFQLTEKEIQTGVAEDLHYLS